jgi:hypothetical protein
MQCLTAFTELSNPHPLSDTSSTYKVSDCLCPDKFSYSRTTYTSANSKVDYIRTSVDEGCNASNCYIRNKGASSSTASKYTTTIFPSSLLRDFAPREMARNKISPNATARAAWFYCAPNNDDDACSGERGRAERKEGGQHSQLQRWGW